MGRPKRGSRGGRGRGGATGTVSDRNSEWNNRPEQKGKGRQGWLETVNDNERLQAYYRAQEIIPESEWPEFLAALRSDLPTTFRITGSRPIAGALHNLIKDTYVPYLTGLTIEGVALSPPKSLEWYPNGYAWQLNVAKNHIRKNEAFKKFQHFLVYETDAGNISRQEAVSMIPPLLLDVQPHHFVLDVCAAPGSKSVQLLEAIHAIQPRSTTGEPFNPVPSGLLIANDSDAKRCHMLVHQSLHRIPASGMMVTNHDASQLPGLRLPVGPVSKDLLVAEEETEEVVDKGRVSKWKSLLYDRVLADVPCSGDGTLRKNVGIWKDWTVGNGAGLHPLQLRILLRAIALLKPGGRLVYSTCSMNPIENEAVVSAALDACPEMSLLAVPDMLPALIRRPGLTTWQVLDNNNEPATRPEDFVPSADKKIKKWTATLWPNGKEAERGLEQCLRIYPHLQDTGGFFVSVLVKAGEPIVMKEEEKSSEAPKRTAAERASSPVAGEPISKRVKQESDIKGESEIAVDAPVVPAEGSEAVKADFNTIPAEIAVISKPAEFKEEPYIYLSPEDPQVKTCLEFFDIHPSFPVASLLVRNAAGAPLRSIYFTSELVRTLLLANSYARMRLISCGVKIFTRQDSGKTETYKCKWRIVSEGLEILRPYMGPKRIIQANLETLKILMGELNVPFAAIKEEAFLARMAEMEPGSCVLEVKTEGDENSLSQNIILPLWRSVVSASLMVEKSEKSAMSLRIFGTDVTPHALGAKPRDIKKAEEAAALIDAALVEAASLKEIKTDEVEVEVETVVAEVPVDEEKIVVE